MSSTRSSDMWAETIPISSLQTLGREIGLRRRTLRLSQRTLSEKTGVTPSAIRRIELVGDDNAPFGEVVRLVEALELDLELRPRGSRFVPRPPTKLNELGLSPSTMSGLMEEGLERIDQLGSATAMLTRPNFTDGNALYEIVCALSRYGLALPASRKPIPGDRELEIFRRRTIDGLLLSELARLNNVKVERIRQILRLFGLSGSPPAASRRRKQIGRAHV